jgi:hypothetical protein
MRRTYEINKYIYTYIQVYILKDNKAMSLRLCEFKHYIYVGLLYIAL